MTRKFHSTLLGAALGWASIAHAVPTFARQESTLTWGACDELYQNFTTLPIDCTNITVPFDYTRPESDETLDIRLLRVPALQQPAKGSIIFHFGGPDPMGQRLTMVGLGELFQVYTGQGFDLITWEQRGTGETTPYKCADDNNETIALMSRGNGAPGPRDDAEIGRLWGYAGQVADSCTRYGGPRFTNTTGSVTAVRDVFQIVDALGGDRKLRYYGISFGTLIGQTAAAMFPDRIESMVLDGNMNAQQYWHSIDTQLSAEADTTFSYFLKTCFEAPDACPLAASHPNSTAYEIEKDVYALLDARKRRPIAFLDPLFGGQLLDHVFIKSMIRPALYDTTLFASMANLLDLLLRDDLEAFITAWLESQSGVSPPSTGGGDNIASTGIICADKFLRTSNVDEIVPLLEEFVAESRLVGDLLSYNAFLCPQWGLPSNERYSGSFLAENPIRTAKPILFVNNAYDVVTPLVSARNASAAFEGSKVLLQHAIGHSSVKQPSLCVPRAVRAYFENGTMPEELECESLQHPWEQQSWVSVFPELGYVRPNVTRRGETGRSETDISRFIRA